MLHICRQLIFLTIFTSFFHLYHALATGFIFEFCLKLLGSNCTSLSCLKTPKNANIYFNLCSFSTHLMETTSLGQKALKGGTTLNNRPIGLCVKILNFNGRFEAFSASMESFCFINRFRIDENLIHVSMFR